MKTTVVILILLVVFRIMAMGQESEQTSMAKNGLFVELLGSGGIYSVNYERRVASHLFLRVGVGYLAESDLFIEVNEKSRNLWVPVMASYVTGNRNGHFEASAGILLMYEHITTEAGNFLDIFPIEAQSDRFFNVHITSFFGYRFQRPNKSFQFRVGFTPILETGDPDGVSLVPLGGISIGYAF